MSPIAILIILIIVALLIWGAVYGYQQMQAKKQTNGDVNTSSGMMNKSDNGDDMQKLKEWAGAFKSMSEELQSIKHVIKTGNIHVKDLSAQLERFMRVDDSNDLFSLNTQTSKQMDMINRRIKGNPYIGLRYGNLSNKDLAKFRQDILDLNHMVSKERNRFFNNIDATYGANVMRSIKDMVSGVNDPSEEDYMLIDDSEDILDNADLMSGCNDIHSEMIEDDSLTIPAFNRYTESRVRFDGFGNAVGANVQHEGDGLMRVTDADYFGALDTNDCGGDYQ